MFDAASLKKAAQRAFSCAIGIRPEEKGDLRRYYRAISIQLRGLRANRPIERIARTVSKEAYSLALILDFHLSKASNVALERLAHAT
jgi:hypothetical protein